MKGGCKMSDKRILFFIGALESGGAERVVSTLSGELAERGYSVEVVTYYDRELFYPLSDKVKYTPIQRETGTASPVKNLFFMRKYFKRNADCVLSFLAPFNMLCIASLLFSRLPLIVCDRNDPRKVPSNSVLRKARDILYRFATAVVLQTSNNKAYFSKKVQKKSTVIFNTVMVGDMAGAALKAEKSPRIVSVGRLMEQKNQVMLLNAFAAVHADYPEYTLTIYGEGPMRERLEAHAAELGIADFVNLPGATGKVYEHYADAELFVLSSDYEGMPNALAEAMCVGLPAVSTDVSGASDLIKNGESGIVCPVGDETAFASAMRKMLADDGLRRACAENAVQINDLLNREKIVGRWVEFIKKVTDK